MPSPEPCERLVQDSMQHTEHLTMTGKERPLEDQGGAYLILPAMLSAEGLCIFLSVKVQCGAPHVVQRVCCGGPSYERVLPPATGKPA